MKKQTTRDKLLDITFQEVYIHGYAATSVDAILTKAKVPKGSMYHHFKSKKELVLAMIEEVLYVKMDSFFKFEKEEGKSVQENLSHTFVSISKNKLLITYGCPLYRLMVELSAVDKEFDAVLTSKATQMKEGLQSLLQMGIDTGEFNDTLDTEAFAWFMLTAGWGILSISPALSTSQSFMAQSRYIFEALDNYTN